MAYKRLADTVWNGLRLSSPMTLFECNQGCLILLLGHEQSLETRRLGREVGRNTIAVGRSRSDKV